MYYYYYYRTRLARGLPTNFFSFAINQVYRERLRHPRVTCEWRNCLPNYRDIIGTGHHDSSCSFAHLCIEYTKSSARNLDPRIIWNGFCRISAWLYATVNNRARACVYHWRVSYLSSTWKQGVLMYHMIIRTGSMDLTSGQGKSIAMAAMVGQHALMEWHENKRILYYTRTVMCTFNSSA